MPITIGKLVFAIVLIISVFGLLFFSGLDDNAPLEYDEVEFLNGWTITTPEGTVTIPDNSYRYPGSGEGTFTAVTVLPGNLPDEANLCLIIGGDAEVYINGEFRKDFISERDVIIPGGCVKRFYFVVPVFNSDSGAEVRLVRYDTSRQGQVFQEALVATDSAFFSFLMQRYGLSMMLSEILMIFSAVIVVISFAMMIVYKRRIEMLFGAMGILVVSGWIVTNSYLYPFVYGHYHVDGVMNYLLCLLMPFNLLFYLDALQHGRYRKVISKVMYLAIGNLLFWPILHFTGVVSFSDILLYINILLGIQVLAVMVILVIDTIKGRVREYKYTAMGFAGFLVCALYELIYLNLSSTLHDELPMLVGLAIFLTLSVVQQICDLRKISDDKQKAVALSEAKTNFLASMSHEIRTPINSILGMNEMILRENKDPQIDDYASSVKSSGKMLLMLVNDVLDFSKIEAGKMEITENDFSMSVLLRDIMPMLKERADEKKLGLNTVLLNEIPDGQISDEIRIRQILINLINNAIKYTDKGSVTLMIGGEYVADDSFTLKLDIKDTGRGISEEGQKNLFEAFARADIRKNRHIEGTGLGLAIVKNIVDSMGGTISVESKLGEGSVFKVVLPVRVFDKQPVREDFMESAKRLPEKEIECDYRAPSAAVLTVDDNASNLKIVGLFLKHAGITPDTCDRGAKAIEMCRKRKYDVILLDHMMPEMDGIETLQRIRDDDASLNRDTVAIVLTANAIAGSRQMYLDAGFADYLTKPIDSALLEQTVKKYLPPDKVLETGADVIHFSTEKSPLEKRLTAIEGLDYDSALEHTGNQEEILEEIVKSVAGECDENTRMLKEYRSKDDLEGYRRYAHTIKGHMATVGLAAFSERARKHEFAGRDGDIDFIDKDMDDFLKKYREVCDKLAGK
ncbi:MAG: response regulator [Lachnospiraceae bacterium]|nr:response regulator [Lachnospiraceae bacterium]